MLKVKCLNCEKIFRTFPCRLKVGEGIYCSRKCMWETNIVKEKIGKANHFSLLGKKRPKIVVEKIKMSLLGKTEEKSRNWKGDNAKYSAKHYWIRNKLGQPDQCEFCSKTGLSGKKIHWANKNHKYKRIISDWLRLCVPCHWRYDHKII